MGFAFPLFTTQMFDALGYRWSLMSVVTAAMEPLELVVVSCIVYQSFESCCEPGPEDDVDL